MPELLTGWQTVWAVLIREKSRATGKARQLSLFGTVVSIMMLTMVVSTMPAGAAEHDSIMAGTARVDITPPLEMKASLGGYGDRMNRPATGVHDRVWAKALVLQQGQKRVVIVTADILALAPGLKSAILEQLASDGWRDDQVLMMASHSHTSIDLETLNPKNIFGIPQLGVFHPELYKRTVGLFAQVIRDASKTLQPCTVGTSRITLQGWSHNRRKDNVAIQPDLTVTRIDGAHGPVALLVNWTAHPTFMDPEDMMYSGDWPGHMQRTLEALIGGGVTAMYYNGAEGDQSPIARPDSGGNWEKAERYGRELGIVVWKLWQTVKPERNAEIASHLTPITLPERTWHPDFMKTGGSEYGMTDDTIRTIINQLVPASTHSVAVRLGSLVIVGVPGELAALLGDEIKARVAHATGARYVVIGGLADEWISYMLQPEQYHKGGYEASMSFYGPNLGPTIVDAIAAGASGLR
jgi:hypothetical protein